MSTNFGCGSRARACSGYVRASLVWCYLQSTLFNQIHVLQSKKEYTPPRRDTKANSGASPTGSKDLLGRRTCT